WPSAEPSMLSAWQRIADIFLTQDDNWRKGITKNQGFPAESEFKNSDEKSTAKYYKLTFKQLLENIADDESAASIRNALADIRKLPAADNYEQQWDLISALLKVLTLLAGELRLEFQAVGKTDFTEIASAAKVALGHKDDPTDLLLALDNQITHLLVDEFQDTSTLQFDLIERLISGWHQSDARTLFLVGDPMQSIYRFRQAEVGLFIKACQEGIGDLSLIPITLTANFRSDEKIVNWVNTIFKPIFPAYDDIPTGAIKYAPSSAMRAFSSTTGVELHAHYNEAEFQLKLLSQLENALADEKQKTIAILVRSRKTAKVILPWLRAAKLPYQAIDIESFELQPLVYDLLALMKALLYLGDKTAWFATLRAPWCGLQISDLLCLAKQNADRCLWETLSTFNILDELSADAKTRLRRVVPVLQHAIAQRFRFPLRQWIEHTWVALGGPACIPVQSSLLDAASFFTMLETFITSAQQFDVAEFERQLNQTYAVAANNDNARIQLMTMHKSKGLEFDTVILPALHENPRNDDKDILVWMEQPRSRQHENDILLAICKPAGVDSDKLYKYIQLQEQKKAAYEMIRILYVAATRAKQQLHLYFNLEQDSDQLLKHNRSFLNLLWPGIENEVRQHMPEPVINPDLISASLEEESHHLLQPIYLHRLPAHWQLPANVNVSKISSTQNEHIVFDWQPDIERRMGIVLHRLFKYLAQQGIPTWLAMAANQQIEFIQQLCILSGMSISQFFSVKASILLCIDKILASQRGQWLFTQLSHPNATVEFALETLHQQEIKQAVLDATFVDEEDTRWIIDYKTAYFSAENVTDFLAIQKEQYAPQLERYARMIAETESRAIKLALYFPLIDQWLEWEYI
ncbi:MAG: UvrD-helicase domain-containing protein, partial [Gammaproteobacteria bacterium]